jgi:hypothetical protein
MELTLEQQQAIATASARARAAEASTTTADPATAYKDPSRPWYSRLGQLADDVVRTTADAATGGYVNNLSADGDEARILAERSKTEAARERLGLPASLVAGAAGAVGPMGLVSKGIRALPGISSLVGAGGKTGLAARTAAEAATGAGYGAVNAAGHGEDVGTGALIGGAAGAVGNVAGEGIAAGVGKVAGAFNKKPPAGPDTDELFRRGEAAYKRADEAGLIINPQGIQELTQRIKADLANKAYDPALAPKLKVVLDRLEGLSQENVTLKGVDTLRKIAKAKVDPANRYEAALSGDVVRHIDDFLDGLNPSHVLAGNKTEAVVALREARREWGQARKSEVIEDAIEAAKDKAASAHSGGNIENSMRQELRKILQNPKKLMGFTPDEQTAMRQVVQGGFGRAMRTIGKLSPDGNGLMLMLHALGTATTGGATIPLAAAGFTAKRLGEQAVHNNVHALARIIRNGGSAEPAIQNAVQRLSEAERESLSHILSSWGVIGANSAAAP